MGGLPQFPITGNILSTNVTKDRISLVNNAIGNQYFPAGQYAFYSKNSSIWYKYKTPTATWSNEILWISNASSSNTKFDSNGYPITAYIAGDNSVKINRYDSNGNFLTNTVAVSGYLPTIAINNLDTYIFWVPPYFDGFLQYTSLCSNFTSVHPYYVNTLQNIGALQIELVKNNVFLFTFELDTASTEKVYVAFTDPAAMLVTYDTLAFLNFIQGTYINNNDFIIAEKSKNDLYQVSIVGSQNSKDVFSIYDSNNQFNLTLVHNEAILPNQDFIIAQDADFEILTEIFFQRAFSEAFKMQDPNIDFALKYTPETTGKTSDSFIVSAISVQDALKEYNVAVYNDKTSSFSVENVNNTFELTSSNSSNSNNLDNMEIQDNFPTYVAGLVIPPAKLPNSNENIIIGNENLQYLANTISINEIKLPKEYFSIDNVSMVYNYVNNPPDIFKAKESLNVFDLNNSFILYPSIYFKNYEEAIVAESSLIPVFTIAKYSNQIKEYLEMKEGIQNILFYEDFSKKFEEQFSIELANVLININVSIDSIKARDNFYIKEPSYQLMFYNDFTINIPKDLGNYIYGVPIKTLNGIPLITFTSSTNANVVSYYYYLDTNIIEYYKGPLQYNINIMEPLVTYKLNAVQ